LISLGDERYTTELQDIETLGYKVVGEMVRVKEKFSGDLFHAEIFKEK
jgi:hypothetical protein